jgi:prefoldin subunit 5
MADFGRWVLGNIQWLASVVVMVGGSCAVWGRYSAAITTLQEGHAKNGSHIEGIMRDMRDAACSTARLEEQVRIVRESQARMESKLDRMTERLAA